MLYLVVTHKTCVNLCMPDKSILGFKLKLQPLIVWAARRLRWCLMGGRREWVGGKKVAESADGRPGADWSSAECPPKSQPPSSVECPSTSSSPLIWARKGPLRWPVVASIVMRRPLHASYLLVSHSTLPPSLKPTTIWAILCCIL